MSKNMMKWYDYRKLSNTLKMIIFQNEWVLQWQKVMSQYMVWFTLSEWIDINKQNQKS